MALQGQQKELFRTVHEVEEQQEHPKVRPTAFVFGPFPVFFLAQLWVTPRCVWLLYVHA